MGLDEVVREIERNAQEQRSKAIAEAKREASAITASARSDAARIKKDAERSAQQEADALKQQELSALKLKLKRELLNSRRQIIEEIHESAGGQLSKMKGSDILLRALLKKAQAELPDAATIHINSADSALFKKLAPKLKQKFLPEDEFGLILEDRSGRIAVNHTFTLLLDQLFERRMGKIYKGVFGSA